MGFGFPRALQKMGIERRVYTSGESKSTNDPFKPEKPEDVKKLKSTLNEMHESFKAMVRERRKGKLKAQDKELFSGAYWTGATGEKLGLVDGLGHMREVMKRKFGEKAQFKHVPMAQGWGLGRFGLDARALADATCDAAEARALWQRFGL
jgi:serine protease SohB